MPTAWRNFEIYCGDRTFYVNAGWLAELSPWFAATCYGEGKPQGCAMDDLRPSELLEFFRCVFYCPTRKPLSDTNVALVHRLAVRFQMRAVMARCEEYIARNVNTFDRNKLFQVACAVSQSDPRSPSMSILVDRMARMKDNELSTMQFSEMPGDVVAEVFAQRTRDTTKRSKSNNKKKFCCIM